MRLLNTKTFQFGEYYDTEVPKYAILSHRWGEDEASFQDFERGVQRTRWGFKKIDQCCLAAAEDDYEWVWIDTCCIDKKSSAELTEAINSMYKWYEEAAVCYVYMVDVTVNPTTNELDGFQESAWFTRGWTLQELLAPNDVRFYDQHWEGMGTKDNLAEEISDITGIDTAYLLPEAELDLNQPCTRSEFCRGHPPRLKFKLTHHKKAKTPSVATRMSWAAQRKTSRVEDIAYCLLGIFGVNMPLLYGEGKKAFQRLQHEIIRQSGDESIFAWISGNPSSGILAPHPICFVRSRYVHEWGPVQSNRGAYFISNKGLEFPLTLRVWDEENGILTVMLDCGMCGPDGFKNVVLKLVPTRPCWSRVHSMSLDLSEDSERWCDSSGGGPDTSIRNAPQLIKEPKAVENSSIFRKKVEIRASSGPVEVSHNDVPSKRVINMTRNREDGLWITSDGRFYGNTPATRGKTGNLWGSLDQNDELSSIIISTSNIIL